MTTMLSTPPGDFSAVYFCPECHAGYASQSDARACADRVERVGLRPGDIVVCGPEYGWYDGLDHWVAEKRKGKGIHGSDAIRFYWVVTHVGQLSDIERPRAFNTLPDDSHKSIVHLRTLGCKNGDPVGLCGWTSRHHYTPEKARRVPAKVLKESGRFVGETYTRLI